MARGPGYALATVSEEGSGTRTAVPRGDRYRFAGDVGGTFTDLVLAAPDGSLSVKKVLSSTGGYEEAILTGMRDLLREQQVTAVEIADVLHGTTVATNAVLERRGAATGLITTLGFRDVLELRRTRMPQLYNVFWQKPVPLVARRYCREVNERVDAQGRVIVPLDIGEVKRVVCDLMDEGVTSIAVCLLHSYMNPAHEMLIGELIRREFPGLFLSLSWEVLPEIKEYERTSTTVTNAYVMPAMSSYLGSLRKGLDTAGVTAPLLIMQSSGGLMTSRLAAQKPVYSLESGPAAGVIGALSLARRVGLTDVVTFDMGGTTAKASLIRDGEPYRATEYEVGAPISVSSRLLKGGGYLIRVPSIDLAEVGAGGGSIVAIDKGGSLEVGPRSAGALPGPVCYDRGGSEPTVTDANVVLGYLNDKYLLGGSLELNAAKAARIVEETISRPLGLTVLEAAYAVHLVCNATMARAIRAVTTERGHDVREFSLIAFGGNGPVHAAELARSLGIRRILIPAAPGLFSAMGLLAASLEQETVQTILRPTRSLSSTEIARLYDRLEGRLQSVLRTEGVDLQNVVYVRYADMRYVDQLHELTVPVSSAEAASLEPQALAELFSREHERAYRHSDDREPTELVNLRVVARYSLSSAPPKHSLPRVRARHRGPSRATRQAYFGRDHGFVQTPVVNREGLGSETIGPLIVEEYDTTIVVPPGFAAQVDSFGNVGLQW